MERSAVTSSAERTRFGGRWSIAEIAAFAHAISGGGSAPIPWDHLRSTTLASILAVRSLREGVPFDLAMAPGESSDR